MIWMSWLVEYNLRNKNKFNLKAYSSLYIINISEKRRKTKTLKMEFAIAHLIRYNLTTYKLQLVTTETTRKKQQQRNKLKN